MERGVSSANDLVRFVLLTLKSDTMDIISPWLITAGNFILQPFADPTVGTSHIPGGSSWIEPLNVDISEGEDTLGPQRVPRAVRW